MASFYSCGYRGDSCGSLEPPFETKLFHLMRNFKLNKHKLSNNHIQFSNQNLLCKFEPLARDASQNVPWSKRPLVKTSPTWSKRPQTRKKDWSKRPQESSPFFKWGISKIYEYLKEKMLVLVSGNDV